MRKVFIKHKIDLCLNILLILLILVFFNREAQMKGIFFGADEIASDVLHFSYPYREYWANQYLKRGEVGLWNPYLASGVPMLAEAQTGMFYPLTVLLYFFLSPPVAFNYLIIGSFIVAGVGTYFYARSLNLPPANSFFVSMVFMFSGFMVARVRHVPIITAVSVMPWMFWTVEKILESYKSYWAGILGILVCTSFFAGHLSSTYVVLFVLAIYFLVRLPSVYKIKGKDAFAPVFIFIGGVLIGVLLASVQLIPSLELIRLSTRDDLNSVLISAVYKIQYLKMFIAPYVLGDPSRGTWNMSTDNYWENIGYIGLAPLFLVFLGIFIALKKRNTFLLTISGITIFTLMLALGNNTPLYRFFLSVVPGAGFTRISGRFILFVDFFGALLSGFALSYVLNSIKKYKKIVLSLVFLATLTDLIMFGYNFNTPMPLNYFAEPESIKFIKNIQEESLYRIRSFDVFRSTWVQTWLVAHGWRGDLAPYIAQREVIPPDLNLLYRLASPSLIYSLAGHFSVKKSGELDELTLETYAKPDKDLFTRLLGMENVKYLLSAQALPEAKNLKLLTTIQNKFGVGDVLIYENKDVLPRAYLVGKAEGIDNETGVLERVILGNFDPKNTVIIKKRQNDLKEGSSEGRVNIKKYEANSVAIDAFSKSGGYLVLSDTNYPGWEASVDGQQEEILIANYNYRAVWLPQGTHSIVFEYKPLSYKIGEYLSIITLIGLTTFFAYQYVHKLNGKSAVSHFPKTNSPFL